MKTPAKVLRVDARRRGPGALRRPRTASPRDESECLGAQRSAAWPSTRAPRLAQAAATGRRLDRRAPSDGESWPAPARRCRSSPFSASRRGRRYHEQPRFMQKGYAFLRSQGPARRRHLRAGPGQLQHVRLPHGAAQFTATTRRTKPILQGTGNDFIAGMQAEGHGRSLGRRRDRLRARPVCTASASIPTSTTRSSPSKRCALTRPRIPARKSVSAGQGSRLARGHRVRLPLPESPGQKQGAVGQRRPRPHKGGFIYYPGATARPARSRSARRPRRAAQLRQHELRGPAQLHLRRPASATTRASPPRSSGWRKLHARGEPCGWPRAGLLLLLPPRAAKGLAAADVSELARPSAAARSRLARRPSRSCSSSFRPPTARGSTTLGRWMEKDPGARHQLRRAGAGDRL